MEEMFNMMKISLFSVRKTRITKQRGMLKNNSAGAAIIVIIIGMIITAILGASILYLFSSSSFTEVFISNREKAYYLAQAGRQYASMVINNANIAGDLDPITSPIAKLNNQTFTLSDGSKFHLTVDVTQIDKRTFVESTGIVNEGTAMEAKQKIAFAIESIRFSQDVFAVESIQVSSRAIIDSYDSRLGPYDPATRTEKANVRTNGITSGAITIIGEVHGNAICGKGGNPLTAISVYGVLTGDRTAATDNVNYTPVTIPAGGDIIPNITVTRDLGVTGTTTVYRTGLVSYSKTPAKTLTIKGNVTLIVDDALGTGDVTMENSQVIIEAGGSLDLYVKQTLTLRGTTIINPPCRLVASPCADPSPATAVRILGISTTVLNFVGASITYGGVNAPGAEFNLQSESQLYGTVVARTIAMSGAKSGSGIHVDKGFSGTSDVGNIVY